jgi:hypothetical protein
MVGIQTDSIMGWKIARVALHRLRLEFAIKSVHRLEIAAEGLRRFEKLCLRCARITRRTNDGMYGSSWCIENMLRVRGRPSKTWTRIPLNAFPHIGSARASRTV